MDFDDLLKRNADEVNAALEAFLPRKASEKWVKDAVGTAAYGIPTVESFLNVPVWDFLDRGGKRWRPLLMFLSCEAVGGNAEHIREFAVIPELIHNGTLMVDDVEDGSLLRRGKPALNVSYGQDIAVNLGNLLFYLPLIAVERSSLPDDKKLRIYELINHELLVLSFGQGSDIVWHKEVLPVSEEQYVAMCASKTGTLARLSAKLGAILGGGNDTLVQALGSFSETIGVSFQIQDDILNLTGELGKEKGEDITEGKLSLPAILALSSAEHANKARLLAILRKHSTNRGEIEEAIAIIQGCGAIEKAAQKARHIVEQSWISLDAALPPSEAKEKLRKLAEFMADRSH